MLIFTMEVYRSAEIKELKYLAAFHLVFGDEVINLVLFFEDCGNFGGLWVG